MARYYNSSFFDYLQYLSLPIYFFFFLAELFLFLVFTRYFNYEPKYGGMMDQLKLMLMIFPIVLLLVVHWLSSVKLMLMIFPVVLLLVVHWLSSDQDSENVPFVISLPEKDSFHRVGGSSLGVGLLLIFLIFMISHHTSFQERWFPLFSRR